MSTPKAVMEIYASRGSKVIFHNKNGWDHERERALKHLKIGEVYTVDRTSVKDDYTDVYLQGFPGIKFNSVQFEDFSELENPPTA